MRWIIVTALLGLTACASASEKAPARWYLYVPPAPHAEMAPDFSMTSWVMQDAFHDQDECLTARSALHLNAMQDSQDLAMRALDGVCFNPDRGTIVR
ncbi:MAG: hypothetical protein ACM3YN_09055 [Parcubacteria group bacterium]